MPIAAAGVIDAVAGGWQCNLACGNRSETAWTPAVLGRLQPITRDRHPDNLFRPAQPGSA